MIKYNKKVDLLSLEKSCLDILKTFTEDTKAKKKYYFKKYMRLMRN